MGLLSDDEGKFALLLARPAIVEVCRQEFGYDLATVAGGG